MGCAGQFQATSHHRTLQAGDHGDAAVLDLVERAVPALAHAHELDAAARLVVVLLQVQACAEMLAPGHQHDGADVCGHGREVGVDRGNRLLVQRVALVGHVQGEDADGALLGRQHEGFGHGNTP